MDNKILFRDEDLEQFSKWRTIEKDKCIACGSKQFSPWTTQGSYKAVQCDKCGLIWMNPFVNDEGLGKYYSDYIGRRRLNNDVKMEQRKIQYQTDRDFIEHYISDGKLLDVGCNGGFFLDVLSKKFEKHGIEIDPEAVAYAKKSYNDFGGNIRCGALQDAPYENATFDVISMRGTIEHMTDPVSAIQKVSQLLKQGGYYFITATPNGDSFAADLYRDKWTLFHPVQHIWHFSPKTLSLICSKFGLQLMAKDFPYLGTPYEKVREDVKLVAAAIKLKEKNPSVELPVSPPFWENMMSLVFVKI
ncbi:MAG: hypothetical protein B7Y56_12700 [Gallionellales bacterium 35-53-114]|jgi:2-polyprenyl-3-methyl-5-hydroxy-6-metoxy-1,4-benzoquinol methylase|nr:MAG: hypothetical protein B7Y56_12700 [Gallionellales bacterium 35-53-114]OYZ63461.1 MAG: hypothetical protein B7Y04_08910 [Gallionellales bacterium 24-53-125]OZB10926.1 MAG: hypothetical protein B7X61_00780 [Gallionellales bacterium 39-52-133]HQS58892.1 class I SAM-dependent methyltransferase [Gallionellaceae bacterium]HQS75723.1 class I SAM-dependent methyltransferase [Gallionellaceae bacterium]